MANLGVFHWIREGVRRSVLLGFSDAVEQLGATADGQEPLHPQLAAALCEQARPTITHESPPPATRPQRKRLGRSLEQLRRPVDERS